MTSSDMTALMLQMIKKMQEQLHVTQEMMQEQQRAADKRQRQFMAAILERRADQTPPPLPDLRSRSPLLSRSTSKSSPGNPRTDNVVQGLLGSTIDAWMCRCAYGNRGRRNEGKPRRFRLRQCRPGPITQRATSLGFIGHFMQGSRVRYCECERVSQRGMGQSRAALLGQRTQGAPTSHH